MFIFGAAEENSQQSRNGTEVPKWEARRLENPSNTTFACDGLNEQGWHYSKNYRVKDNFGNLVNNAGVDEAFSGSNVWPRVISHGGSAADGTFADDIFVCATPGGLNPMPENPHQGTTLVDSFNQKWCSGSDIVNFWGEPCSGFQMQSGTVKRYLDHGDLTVP